jgi:uncharacterized protein YdhG (YjbR/CyaY superfamily)
MSLSQQELCAISERISRDYAPRFSRHGHTASQGMHFSSRELQEISRQISLDFAPALKADQSQLVLMAVSPNRLHVYWQVANQLSPEQRVSPKNQVSTPAPEALMLRIYGQSQPEFEPHSSVNNCPGERQSEILEKVMSTHDKASPCVELSLDAWQGQQDILLPQATGSSTRRYNAVLGESGANVTFKPLAYSNITALPTSNRPIRANFMDPIIGQFVIAHSALSSFSAGVISGQGKQIL